MNNVVKRVNRHTSESTSAIKLTKEQMVSTVLLKGVSGTVFTASSCGESASIGSYEYQLASRLFFGWKSTHALYAPCLFSALSALDLDEGRYPGESRTRKGWRYCYSITTSLETRGKKAQRSVGRNVQKELCFGSIFDRFRNICHQWHLCGLIGEDMCCECRAELKKSNGISYPEFEIPKPFRN